MQNTRLKKEDRPQNVSSDRRPVLLQQKPPAPFAVCKALILEPNKNWVKALASIDKCVLGRMRRCHPVSIPK